MLIVQKNLHSRLQNAGHPSSSPRDKHVFIAAYSVLILRYAPQYIFLYVYVLQQLQLYRVVEYAGKPRYFAFIGNGLNAFFACHNISDLYSIVICQISQVLKVFYGIFFFPFVYTFGHPVKIINYKYGIYTSSPKSIKSII
ncbi:hypothetical protein SDC9_120812 [bioreactor metagenome]|uniref:Uncharacterized protein n=1 Tax=bioreactor metagenome TaxID=1076179 RepID=A0A645CA71_9ZZZZ